MQFSDLIQAASLIAQAIYLIIGIMIGVFITRLGSKVYGLGIVVDRLRRDVDTIKEKEKAAPKKDF